MILPVGRSTTSRNASATLAFHQFRQTAAQEGEEVAERANIIKIAIERVESKYRARLHIEVAKSFSILGPPRDSRPEAIKDGVELGKAFVAEGAVGARRAATKLEGRRWTPKEIETADERELDGFVLSNQVNQGVKQKLIPPGEGWVRFDETKLVDPRSQVYFVQIGPGAGEYLKPNASGKLEEVDMPHVPVEHPCTLSAASASWVRRGGKLERAVLLNDITKIARLALKFPLSFLDTPACAYALFQGLRNSESAQWCAENFHKKLLPLLAEKIHTYEMHELQDVLKRTLEALDAELLRSQHAFSGCSAMVALVLGDRVVVAGVGHVRAVLLPEKGPLRPVLTCTGSLDNPAERERIKEARGVVRDGVVFSNVEGLDEACRILACKHVFDVLQIDPGGPSDEKQVRTAYRKLALRVHPDKQSEGAEIDTFKEAFARLDSAKEALEQMLGDDAESCRELHRILRFDIHTRVGAGALLGVDASPSLDTNLVGDEAEKASKELIRKVERMRAAPDYERAVASIHEAVATIRRGCTPEGLPRQELLLREGLSSGRTMGARDLRWPHPIVVMKPETAALPLPHGRYRLGLLCGGTAQLSDEQLAKTAAKLLRQPKATALRWCVNSDASASSSSAVCVTLERAGAKSEEPASKRAKTAAAGSREGAVRVRHILFRHQQLRGADPIARREGAAKNSQEAEVAALDALEKLLQDPNQFLKLCRELSDCQSATQPGTLAGDLGWLGRGQQEQTFEDAVFGLTPNCFGDLVTTSRGVHIIQRLA